MRSSSRPRPRRHSEQERRYATLAPRLAKNRGPTMTKFFGALVLLGCLLGATAAQAQSYPTKQITLVVTAAAGGVTDVVARAIGQRLAEAWGQQVVIENRGGAAHILGAQAVAKA